MDKAKIIVSTALVIFGILGISLFGFSIYSGSLCTSEITGYYLLNSSGIKIENKTIFPYSSPIDSGRMIRVCEGKINKLSYNINSRDDCEITFLTNGQREREIINGTIVELKGNELMIIQQEGIFCDWKFK